MRTMREVKKAAMDFIDNFAAYNDGVSQEKVVAAISPQKLQEVREIAVPRKGRPLNEVMRELTQDIMPYGNHSSHPRFFGFVPGAASALSWLGDIVTASYNRHAGGAANQPAIWEIEQKLIAWLAEQAGFPKSAGGTFVSGGSMANLTAAVAARDVKLGEEERHLGVAYASDQTHSSVAKGLRIAGIGESRIRIIPTDELFRLDAAELEKAVQADVEAGLRPFLVVASAGTTNTGSIDPFRAIRKICDRYDLWMHVDGAFGASALLSAKYKNLLDGIEEADSLSWDAHKWLFQSFGCGIVLARDKNDLLRSFSVHPEYLKDLESESVEINPWDLGIELTRPVRCIKLWLTLQAEGTDKMGEDIERGIEMAKWIESKLSANPHIVMAAPVTMAMVNFRYTFAGYSEEQNDRLNAEISARMLQDGYAGTFTTELRGRKVLRLCIINPQTTREELMNTLILMEKFYGQIIAEGRERQTGREQSPAEILY